MAEARNSWGVVGYRHFSDRAHFDRRMAEVAAAHGAPERVVSGGATGADAMARDWARERGVALLEHLPAEFTSVVLKARNTLIVRDCALVVAFLSRRSRGTKDTIAKARDSGQAAGRQVVVSTSTERGGRIS